MAYRNKTYVAFDGDNDMWAYAFMKGWNSLDHVDFDFYDAHSIKELSAYASNEQYIKRILRERLENSKHFILLVGESTKNLRKYVQWEIDLAIELDLPIIVVNLNKKNRCVPELCPVSLRNHVAVHGPFKKDYIKKAMDDFSAKYYHYKKKFNGPVWYSDYD